MCDCHVPAFTSRSLTWEDYLTLTHLHTHQKETIKKRHLELVKAEQILKRYLHGLRSTVDDWLLTERKRSLAIIASKEHKGREEFKYVQAVRENDARLSQVDDVPLYILQKEIKG